MCGVKARNSFFCCSAPTSIVFSNKNLGVGAEVNVLKGGSMEKKVEKEVGRVGPQWAVYLKKKSPDCKEVRLSPLCNTFSEAKALL